MTTQAVVLIAGFTLYFMTTVRRVGLLSASSIFSYSQMLMGIGVLRLLTASNDADLAHSWLITLAMLLYFLSSSLFAFAQKPAGGKTLHIATSYPKRTVRLLVILSMGVAVAYYYLIGTSALIVGLTNSLAASNVDVAGIRLAGYASTEYFAPGYVNQFKNVLLPALVVVVGTSWVKTRSAYSWTLLPLGLFTMFALLGTGQRAPFFLFTAVTVVYLYRISGRRITGSVYKFAGVAIILLLVTTFALGRSANTVQAQDNPFAKIGTIAGELLGRVTVSQQLAAVAGFRYIYHEPIQNGGEWVDSVAGLLPGHRGSDLANRIFATLYGSTRGTSPPSIWSSVYYNFGWPGIVVFPLVLGAMLTWVAAPSSVSGTTNTLEIMGLAGVSVILGSWVSGSPVYLLNTGIVVYAWMWWLGKRQRLRRRTIASLDGGAVPKRSPAELDSIPSQILRDEHSSPFG